VAFSFVMNMCGVPFLIKGAIAMVEKGLCITLCPSMLLQGHPCRVATLELDPPQFRTLGIVAPSFDALSPAAKKFLTYAKRIVPSLP
jgi:DNA-binding transcriptional LysR family regulator